MKRLLSEKEGGFPDDIVAQAFVEEYAFKLFDKADSDDRASNFSKCVCVCVWEGDVCVW